MKRIALLFIPAVLCICGQAIFCADEQAVEKSKLRVGTFDSRLVTIAYVRSSVFEKRMKELQEELKKAEAAGDSKRVKALNAQGLAMQDTIHKQGFSTWPIDNILETIKTEIPEIAKKAQVDAIVSKWDVVYQRPGVEFVDVTDLMVEKFHPDKATRKVMADIKEKPPVPLEKLESH
ncbi:MAG: hypothetical protein KDA84_00915 [Planctomycetaceae bacterium]|nr:hypothetical protein [Planctomycetaceae bacterium]